mmetsp:Transcript_8956/g.14929  ORF Transcript_8956/g.14929 Transcript_8956/m.14929 type:complete len:317 (+) Transcript_8956:17-967(+)
MRRPNVSIVIVIAEICSTIIFLLLVFVLQVCSYAMPSPNPPMVDVTQLPEIAGNSSSATKINDESCLLVIRLYLVRHGETEANRNRIAAGQMKSPLTDLGVRQATALQAAISHLGFDAFVVSDMERTRHTARLVAPHPSTAFLVEARLREMAKGAREGFPKSMAYEEALRMRQQSGAEADDVPPKLESDEDVWTRVSDWLMETLREVATLYGESAEPSPPQSRLHSILAVTHAGVIRTLCAQLVPEQLPKSVDISAMGRDGSTEKHLVVPNGSVTVLDFILRDQGADLQKKLAEAERATDLFEIKLKLLNWNDHLL